MNTLKLSVLATALLAVCGTAQAKISLNVGAINVAPNESSAYLNTVETVAGLPTNSTELGLNSNTQLGLTIDYHYSDNVIFELVAATPFSHEISVKSEASVVDGLKAGNTKHLPPTVLAQYHFGEAEAAFRPFVGAGINYTVFFDEEVNNLDSAFTSLALIGADDKLTLDLDPSIGLAVQAGFNYKLNDKWGIHAMAMWADIAAEGAVELNGTELQSVNIDVDPIVLMVGAKYYF